MLILGIIMYRLSLTYLNNWKINSDRKPLIIRGARQIGKSYLVKEFGQQSFSHMIVIDFEKDSHLKELFVSNSPQKIIQLLEIHYGQKITPGETLLFLDEIQAAGEVLAKLRYFYEEMPLLHIIAAGSLLDFILKDHTFSMPVGRIEYLHLGPMSFEEFLLAVHEKNVYEYLLRYTLDEPIPLSIHEKLNSLVKLYCITGGMPSVIKRYVETNSLNDCDKIKNNILLTYEDDFSKYSKKVNVDLLRTVFKKIPLVVGDKFKYANIDPRVRAKDIAGSLSMLCNAKIAYNIYHSSSNGIPLRAQINESIFKVLFVDVGLFTTLSGLTLIDLERTKDLTLINQGKISEQFVGQHLLYAEPEYKNPELFYWVREKSSSNAEVDYVISMGTEIIPIEVKSGKTGRLKSLHIFMGEKKKKIAVRINNDVPSITESVKTDDHAYTLISLPFYLTNQIKRIIRSL